MPAKYYKHILTYGIFLGFISLFLVFENFLFPYITSKQIYFNILLEILAAVWILFILQYPEARPKKSLVTYGLLAFFGALLISSIFSVDINLSFWGDVERMLGWFHLVHFLLFYLIIITIFREWRDWKNLFIFFTLVSVVISIVGIGQRYEIFKSPWGTDRVISLIGNAAYVGAFAIFSIYFTLILIFREKNRILIALYALAGLLSFLVLVFSGTRGAYLGFGLGMIIFFFLYGILGDNRLIRRASWGLIIFSALAAILIFANRDSQFVKDSAFLRRITTSKLTDATLQTRIISWKTAVKDFPAHPILGTGYGNFAITFDKYFDPVFYNHTSSETYFDRAHNNLVDIISTTGAVGGLTYLFIFAACFYYLIRGYRSGEINLADFGLLVTLLIAYFIQNLFVFDALATYIPLMVALGFIHWLAGEGKNEPENAFSWDEIEDEERKFKQRDIIIGAAAGLILLTILYQYNIKPARMLAATINGQMEFSVNGDIVKATEAYKKALSFKTPLDRDSRNSYVSSLAKNSPALNSLPREKGEEIVKFGVELAEENVKYNKEDSMYQLVLGQMYYVASVYFSQTDKFAYYSDLAEEAIDKAIASSPGRVPVYFEKAQIYLSRGKIEEAVKIIDEAIKINPKYPSGYCHLAKIYLVLKDENKAYANLDQCLDSSGGPSNINSLNFIQQASDHYKKAGDKTRLIALLAQATQLDKKNSSLWSELARLYAEVGQKSLAIDAAKKAAEIDPGLKSAAETFIRQLGE